MKKSVPGIIQKNFGYSHVRWDIKDFSLGTCQERFVVSSPTFMIYGPEITDWKMEFETTSGEDGCVLFNLERLNRGPHVVWVDWTVNIMDLEFTSHVAYDCESFFERKYKYVIDLESTEHILDILAGHASYDTLIIECYILVKHESDAKILPNETIDAGLESLSQDFRRMFSQGKYYDVVLRMGNKDIRAHKSILVRRNKVLEQLISNAEYSKIVILTEFDAEATEAVIAFLYTGNLHYIFSNPSLALLACIELFDVEELKPYFYHDSVTITSKVTSQEFCFRWLIPNFGGRKTKYVRSGIMRRTGINSTWRLHIYPFGQNRCSQVVAIYAEIVSSTEFQDACVEFALLNACNESVNKVKVQKQIVAGEWVGVENFYPRCVLEDVLRNGDLRIVFTIRLFKGGFASRISSKNVERITAVRTLPHYRALSKEMEGLLKSTLYKDVFLKAKRSVIQAHKCILAARSKTFSQILGKLKDKIITDIEDDIFRIFVKYLYSGNLGDQGIRVLFYLYKTAEEYCIPSLKWDCCRSLSSKLDVKTVFEILVFAEDNQVQELKSSCLKFIRIYKNDILEDSNWKDMAEMRPAVFKGIGEYLTLSI